MYNSPRLDEERIFIDESLFFFDELRPKIDIISATEILTFEPGFFVVCIDLFRSRTSCGIRIYGNGVCPFGRLFRMILNYTFASH